jgi:hypothetical protein
MDVKLLTTMEAARLLGVTHQAFSKGVKSGRYTVAEVNEAGRNLFDPETIRREYAETREAAELQDHARYFRSGGAVEGRDSEAKRMLKMKYRKETAQAKKIEFELKIKREEYIKKDVVRQQGIELGRVMMSFLTAWPSRLAPILMGMKDADEHDFMRFLEDEVDVLIRAIRSGLGAKNE